MQPRFNELHAIDFGWPFFAWRRAEALRAIQSWDGQFTFHESLSRDAFGWSKKPRMLPPIPLWRGIALNTLIFAAPIACTWWLLVAIRLRRRNHRNLCPHCGYPREGLASPETPCPECGCSAYSAPATSSAAPPAPHR